MVQEQFTPASLKGDSKSFAVLATDRPNCQRTAEEHPPRRNRPKLSPMRKSSGPWYPVSVETKPSPKPTRTNHFLQKPSVPLLTHPPASRGGRHHHRRQELYYRPRRTVQEASGNKSRVALHPGRGKHSCREVNQSLIGMIGQVRLKRSSRLHRR